MSCAFRVERLWDAQILKVSLVPFTLWPFPRSSPKYPLLERKSGGHRLYESSIAIKNSFEKVCSESISLGDVPREPGAAAAPLNWSDSSFSSCIYCRSRASCGDGSATFPFASVTPLVQKKVRATAHLWPASPCLTHKHPQTNSLLMKRWIWNRIDYKDKKRRKERIVSWHEAHYLW